MCDHALRNFHRKFKKTVLNGHVFTVLMQRGKLLTFRQPFVYSCKKRSPGGTRTPGLGTAELLLFSRVPSIKEYR